MTPHRDPPSGGLPPLSASKTWPEVPSSIERSEALHKPASGRTTGASPSMNPPMRAAYRAPDANLEAMRELSRRYAENGRVEDGLRLALVCIAEEPLHHGGYLTAAVIQEARGRYAEAALLFERALVVYAEAPGAREGMERARAALHRASGRQTPNS